MHRLRMGLLPAALILTTTLGGCMSAPPASQPVADCPVIGVGKFEAWLDTMPGPGYSGPSLNISGTVETPTPGYRLALVAGPADRMMPPSQRFLLVGTPPSGMAAQVVTKTEVHYRARAQYPAYRSLIVGCGDRTLVTIAEVSTVH